MENTTQKENQDMMQQAAGQAEQQPVQQVASQAAPAPLKKKNHHIGWIIVAAIVAIALIWWGISAAINASRRNAAPLPRQILVTAARTGNNTRGSGSTDRQAQKGSGNAGSNPSVSVHYRYDKSTRILYVTGDTTSYKWLIPFIDTSTPLGRQTALIAASGDNIDSIMVFYILSSSPTVSSGKVKKVTLNLGNGARTDYYFLTSGGKTTRINAFKVGYDKDKITSIGDRAFGYNPNGLLQTVGDVLSMQFAKNGEMSKMVLSDNITGSQYQFRYSGKGNSSVISFTGNNTFLGFNESGTVHVLLGTSYLKQVNTRSGNYTIEISR